MSVTFSAILTTVWWANWVWRGGVAILSLQQVINPSVGRISTLFFSLSLLHSFMKFFHTGFSAIYVMAHELGHNLGMLHDDKAGCARDGFIMSPTRGSTGETEWSKCSAELLREGVGHGCLLTEESQAVDGPRPDENLLPGQIWSPAAQCQVNFGGQ